MLVYVAAVDWAGGELVWAVPAEVLEDMQRRVLRAELGSIMSAGFPRDPSPWAGISLGRLTILGSAPALALLGPGSLGSKLV